MGCDYTGKAFTSSNCKTNFAGVKKFWHRQYATAIMATAGIVANAGAGWLEFQLPVDTGDAVEDMEVNVQQGVSAVNQTVTAASPGLSNEDQIALSQMMRTKQHLIAELYNGTYVLYGAGNGMDITAGGSRTGAASSDLQGYEITWTGKEKDYAYFVTTFN